MDLVFAKFTTWAGPTVQLIEGEAWTADDPVVRAHPDWFDDHPKIVRTSVHRPRPVVDEPVEQATKAPGEKRSIKRG